MTVIHTYFKPLPDKDSFCEGLMSVSETNNNPFVNFHNKLPCQVGLVVSVSTSHALGHEFASRPGHTKDHHKNGMNCLPA